MGKNAEAMAKETAQMSYSLHRPGIEPGAGRIIRDDISYGNGQFYH